MADAKELVLVLKAALDNAIIKNIELSPDSSVADLFAAAGSAMSIPPHCLDIICDLHGPQETVDTSGQTVSINELLRWHEKSDHQRSLYSVGVVSGMNLLVSRRPVSWCWASLTGMPSTSSKPGRVNCEEQAGQSFCAAVLVVDAQFPETAEDVLSFLKGTGTYEHEPVYPIDKPPWFAESPLEELEISTGFSCVSLAKLGVTKHQLLGAPEGMEDDELQALADKRIFYTGEFSFDESDNADGMVTWDEEVVIFADSEHKLITFAWHFVFD
eukprot:gnl/TRDRNA2_/TRDRNA2_172652_c0_seq1.p1 gnl/TRDRNA2_/TRDRNA2_172652_c0~~gnl/TRDRNA2_/TRDRNA2_172652_c0_seq1.p1  ORF type:complete len:271 (+),score=39.10 gnl/TRDRNA2_/TRDRNA2_172652_c0_seq1:601-1413(+)